jgi:hypothetical protein
MPETTSAINACNVTALLDDNTGHLVDISGSANNATLNFSQEIGDFKVFGGTWIKRLVCKKDATANLTIVYTTAAAEGMRLLKDWWNNSSSTPRHLRILVPDDSVGADDYEGLFLIDTMNVPLDGTQATPVLVALTLKQTGGVAIGTQAT